MKKRFWLWLGAFLLLGMILLLVLDWINLIPHQKFTNDDFGIPTYQSKQDKDQDGIEDQADILKSVREYIAKNPQYESKYYATGYPNDNKGVCTDVVSFGLLGAGYDLKELLNEDVLQNQKEYEIDIVDKNIDFRRVLNINTYLKRNAITLTNDLSMISEWQGGDIVVFQKHIGIVSNFRNRQGIPFLIHHANPYQIHYEEDVLGRYQKDIIGHYRIS